MQTEMIDFRVFGERPPTLTVPQGSVVFLSGDAGAQAYVVRSGVVQLRGAGRVLDTLGEGGLFGAMAIIDGGVRSASAVAVEEAQLIVIGAEDFHRYVVEAPGFATYVMQNLVRRLRVADAESLEPDRRKLAEGRP
ncbi:MAG: Crp/Fnr family transcriptional regulator [Alphaproteobacteria bacterium]